MGRKRILPQKRPDAGGEVCEQASFLFFLYKILYQETSLKDAGKKCFGITLLEDDGIVRDILQRLELETEE